MIPIAELFQVVYGHSLELNRLKKLSPLEGGVAFVSRKMGDNGISAYVEKIPDLEPGQPGELTCALGGNGVLSTFLQDQTFYTGRDVARLIPKYDLEPAVLLFYCACIVANRYRFSYGRQANRTLKNLRVPSLQEVPEYIWRVNIYRYDGAESAAVERPSMDLSEAHSWAEFRLGDLFDLRKGQRLTKAKMRPGTTPYVGASETFNGITGYINVRPDHVGGTISVTYNGSVGEAFYQPVDYWAGDDVNILYPRFEMSGTVALFICTVIRLEKYRFNYGRKWHLERMKSSFVRLPVDRHGFPDWVFMDSFVRRLPYSSQAYS